MPDKRTNAKYMMEKIIKEVKEGWAGPENNE